jgi:malonyl-CoA O-methyltransferase
MSEPERLRTRRVQRNFARAAAHYESFAVLSREVAARMLERLTLMQSTPQRVLDLGSGTGIAARAVAERYPAAEILALDLSLPMLQQQTHPGGWRRAWRMLSGRSGRNSICADFERLPMRSSSVDMVIANLALHWGGAPAVAFGEAAAVLRAGGLFMFTTFGPDTLKELAQATAGESTPTPVHSFIDMHDLGDALIAGGFSDPVMEMEKLTLTYENLEGLWRDLRGMGGISTHAPSAGLRTPRWQARVAQRYERLRQNGRLPATFELVFGHAWKAEPRAAQSADGVAVIRFQPRTRKV